MARGITRSRKFGSLRRAVSYTHLGDIVYFQKKKARADKPYLEHTVQVGESMHSISQLYGIRLRNLYRLNKKSYGYIPEEGDVLKLR